MSVLELMTFDSFKIWSAAALKSFLALRNKSTEGSYEELVSR